MANQTKKLTGTYRSDAFAAIHETAEALHRVGAIDEIILYEFSESCLEPDLGTTPLKVRMRQQRNNENPNISSS